MLITTHNLIMVPLIPIVWKTKIPRSDAKHLHVELIWVKIISEFFLCKRRHMDYIINYALILSLYDTFDTITPTLQYLAFTAPLKFLT